ncbi:bifunctional [glutamine synthetase] adenylyltransferase/[glutamine synthetase]-adenylyl-L-tyrosine phosphorylase [Alphaproteobacteria bacterium]|nr:bifunctional [glutamine synthetase] adenylyltransferase/[glutamine synthetase]-adenylyl-L-tyrosine phosphorylase [Alphaproteobacteria bacterium]
MCSAQTDQAACGRKFVSPKMGKPMDKVLFPHVPNHAPLDPAHASALLADITANLSPQTLAAMQAKQSFFLWVVEGSSFLARLMRRFPDVLEALVETSPAAYLDGLLEALPNQVKTAETRDQAMQYLRNTRNRLALVTALADLADQWDVDTVTAYLTRLADIAVSASVDFLLSQAIQAAILHPFERSGLVVLALGKHGGQELNYSSDIDIVIYYTSDALSLAASQDEGKFYITLARDLTAMLQNQTADGFVFRVDMRLRPDPGATQLAIPVHAALAYYESMGQNWERAVYIKARPIAGDIEAAQGFLKELQPYIWRRYYDFAAIEDVHSMKRQIHAVRGHAALATSGHNLKLGRGGIREIEFFVQTQQLIAGGRDADLRGHRTVEMLQMLAEKNWINQEAADGLCLSYNFLRRLEHRLQMRLDEQTQTLPHAGDEFDHFARFAGYATNAGFEADLMHHLVYVTQQYGLLFEQAESLSAEAGNLVFTGSEDDPETLQTLSQMGFKRARDVSALIRGWHAGRLKATRTARSREILTRLQPQILSILASAADPDDSFLRFDNLLQSLPSGVQIFSLFQSNPHVLALLGDIVSLAPRLIDFLSGNGRLMDVLLTRGTSSGDELSAITALKPELEFEDVMGELRLQVHEGFFQIGTSILADPVMAADYGGRYTALAEQSIAALLPPVLNDIERQYGDLEGSGFALVGMGKLGSREMTLQSDLDMIMICDCDDFSKLSNGPKPIDAETWFSRAARRFISGLSAPTVQGRLYEVDMRLRPSGKSGALVAKISGFIEYQTSQAWSWEHLALTRARVLAGDSNLTAKINAAIGEVLTMPRDLAVLSADISDMRQRLLDHAPIRGPFDIRRGKGGLVELEFACQTLQLAHAPNHRQLIGARNLPDLIGDLYQAEILTPSQFEGARDAAHYFSTLRQIGSLCLEDNELTPASGIRNLLLEALNEPDIGRLAASLQTHRRAVEELLSETLQTLNG